MSLFGKARWRGLAALLGLVFSAGAHAQAPGLGMNAELVDPHVFRVCADPHNMPFSDTEHQGFENKIAELFAAKLGKSISYTYYPQVIGFVRNTLNIFRCDVVMGTAQADEEVQTTNPYYHTMYVLVVKSGSPLASVDSLGDPRLKGKHLGVIAGTPPASVMSADGLMAGAEPFPLTVDTRVDAPSKAMVDEVADGKLDGGVVWGPLGGYYAKLSAGKVVAIPLLKEHGVPMDFSISMGVRHSDQAWKRKLNGLIARNQDAINKILADYGVPLLDSQGKLITP